MLLTFHVLQYMFENVIFFWGGAFGWTNEENVHCFLTLHEPNDQHIIPGLKTNTPTHQVEHVYMYKHFLFFFLRLTKSCQTWCPQGGKRGLHSIEKLRYQTHILSLAEHSTLL